MTGQAAPRHGVTTWTHPKKSSVDTGRVQTKTIKSPGDWTIKGLDLSLPLLPRILRDSGYATLFAGKAHFGPDDTPSGNPLNLGFEVNMDDEGRFTYVKPPQPEDQQQQDEVELDPYAGTNIDAGHLGQMMEAGNKPSMADAGKPAEVKSRNKRSMSVGPDKRFSGLPKDAGNENVDKRTERRVG